MNIFRKILLIVLLILIIPTVNSTVETIRIYPSDDTMGMQVAPTSNFGTDIFFAIRNETAGSDNITSWLKFSMASIPAFASINSSRLFLYTVSTVTKGNVTVYQLDNQTWVELQPTWNSQVKGTKNYINATKATANATRFGFNVTSWVSNQYSGNKANVSFTLKKTPRWVEGGRQSFGSKDNVLSQRSYLNVTVTYVSLPAPSQGLSIRSGATLQIAGDGRLTISS